jgi:hypothetical protein
VDRGGEGGGEHGCEPAAGCPRGSGAVGGSESGPPPPASKEPRAARSPAPAPPMAADLEAAAYALLGALFLVFAALIVLGY